MKVLILGSGGRENAIAWKIAQSEALTKLFIAPGNAGSGQYGEVADIKVTDFEQIKSFALENEIEMIIVGPEVPLVAGISDFFKNDEQTKNILIIGPSKAGAELEGSKEFSKKFMQRHHIPTARYAAFNANQFDEGCSFLETLNPPYVLKADGLAAGKGVLILDALDEAESSLKEMLIDEKFGEASGTVVIEEFMKGIELSVFVLTDGEHYLILPEAKDYKRIGKGDTGLNTGGMGAVSPVPFADSEFMSKVEEWIIKPTINGLKKDNIFYQGFLFIGLMNVEGNPFVVEYNVRMGDPETTAVMPRIKNDLLPILKAVGTGTLKEHKIKTDERAVGAVVLVAGGYPESYEKGKEITGLENIRNTIVFQAGTKKEKDKIVTNSGRVMAVTAYGKYIETALKTIYDEIPSINYEGKYFRRDIGFDL